jgi:hypothetical protein
MTKLNMVYEQTFFVIFSQEGNLVYVIKQILSRALGKHHEPNEWRLFLYSSKLTLKAVLLHNENGYPLVKYEGITRR